MATTTELERQLQEVRRTIDDVRREARANNQTFAVAIRKTRAQVDQNELQRSIRSLRPSSTALLWDPRAGDFVDPNLATSLISRLRAGDPVTSRLGTDSSTIGLRNFFKDARMVSGNFIAISLNDALVHQANYDWSTIAAFGATGAQADVTKLAGLNTPDVNPLASSTMDMRLFSWTAAGVASIKAKSTLAAPSFVTNVLPYAVFSAVIYKNPLVAHAFTNVSSARVKLVIRNAADTVDLATNAGVDFAAMASGEYVRLWVVIPSASWSGVNVIAQVQVDVTTTGSGGAASFSVGVGDPQFELAPEQVPTIFIPEPPHSSIVHRASAAGSLDNAALVARLLTDTGSTRDSRLVIGLNGSLDGIIGFGTGLAAQDTRIRRGAAAVLRLDNANAGPAALETYAGTGLGTPAAGLGRLYFSSVDKLWHGVDDAGVDSALGVAPVVATQVSRSAVSGSSDYVARIKIAADTTYRAFLGLQSGDAGSLEYGAGGVAARDLRLSRAGAAILQIDSNGVAADVRTIWRSNAGSRAYIDLAVTGDTQERILIEGDATLTGITMSSGAAGHDLRIRRSAAKTLLVDDNAGGNLTLVNFLTASLQRAGTEVSVVGHGAADHADITRKLFMFGNAAKIDGTSTLVNLGASPNLTPAVAYPDAATSGAFWAFEVPVDWASGVITVQPVWAPGATDAVAHTVRWTITAKTVAAGVTITAAGTAVTFTGASAARTVGVVVYDTATSTTLTPAAAGDLFTIELQRIGADAADTYVGVVNLLGVIVSYTANQ